MTYTNVCTYIATYVHLHVHLPCVCARDASARTPYLATSAS